MLNLKLRSLIQPLLVLVLGIVLSAGACGQSAAKPDWSDWKFLIGEWTAEQSSGVPGPASSAMFSLTPDLQGAILVRKNHAEYPPAKGKPRIIHDDLMIVYQENGAIRAFYDDNEGHVIRYEVSVSADKQKIVMLSEKNAGAPRFRLTYVAVKPDAVTVTFEIAQPGKTDEFKVYAQGTVVRKK